MARGRTVCPFRISYLRDPSRNDQAFHPSGTAQDRMYVVRGTQFRHSIQPYISNTGEWAIATTQGIIVLTRRSQ